MFQDALFESGHDPRFRKMTAVSFVLQALALALVVIVPLLHIEGPPHLRSVLAAINFSPPPPPAPPSTSVRASHVGFSEIVGHGVTLPTRIPRDVAVIHDEGAPPPPLSAGNGVLWGTGSNAGRNVTDLLGSPTAAPMRPNVPPNPVKVSTGVMQGFLLRRVQPAYPLAAQAARIQGVVVLTAVISREGMIENIRVVSGHPLLVGAAVEAVRQWRYRPYLLNDQPVEVETQITVNFTISGG